ncbi:mechanosensitive ion channel protein 6-like isoform X3 [Telopea speciosissima]|uniref:mechanosensitive ion channel protein 6-like isoform X2 n=1 Tax=Telopea speciosissima TaxID=54955 RepID=UPI001CC5AE8A|nr:mechanosensitive ion channel protein 6-like isoform X2 [Telopea speciosissima]XP_043713672.1 mechanosensitive ion channel protein 6-like isoform X3 [Telopea speciosissima]
MDSLRRSFKSHSSYRKMSPGGIGPESSFEKQPMLPIPDHEDQITKSADHGHRGEFVVKIDGYNESNSKNNNVEQVLESSESKIWRESSYDFRIDGGAVGRDGGNAGQNGGGMEDPPSRLIGQFLHKQKASGEMALDMDLEMDELQSGLDRNLPAVIESPKDLKVSFQGASRNHIEISSESVQPVHDDDSSDEEKQHKNQLPPRSPKLDGHEGGSVGGGGRSGVVRCTSNAVFRPTSGLLRTRTKSRLMDPVGEPERRSARNTAKSGILKAGKSGMMVEEEEEDPFLEDIPEEFRKAKLSVLTLLECVSLILIIAAFVASLTVPTLQKKLVWNLHLWKWEVLILVLICGRLVSGWTIRIAVFFIERNFMLRKRVLYFVYGVKNAFQNCIWLALVLIVWYAMLDKKVRNDDQAKILTYVTKILVCLLVSTAIWLVKTLLVKVLASSFHVNAYFDRIQDSLFNQFVIETLSGAPLIELHHTQEDNEKCMAEIRQLQNAGATMPADLREAALPSVKGGRVIGSGGLQRSPRVIKSPKSSGPVSKQQDEGISIDHLHKLNQKNISAWNMKRLMNIIRRGTISTLDERILESSEHEEANTQIKSEFEAKVVAKKIFRNVAKPRSKYIYLEDLMRFMREDEAVKTMSLFEGAKDNKRISKFSLKNWVVNAFRERRALALTLNDTKTAVNKLHHILNIVVGIIIIIIWLLILGIATTHFLVFISSQFLLVVFIFGNTCKTTFEAIIFLFAIHPFDVGDRCEIQGVQMIVEEMNILSTVFLRYDNLKITYPNNVLATMPISNYYRSPDMGDAIDFCIHVSTPLEKIAIMKQKIIRYTEIKEDHWCPGAMVVLRDVEDMNRLKISVWLSHRMNHQDMGERFARRERLVEEIVKILKELDIEYRMLPLDINVRNMPAITSTRLPSNWTCCA